MPRIAPLRKTFSRPVSSGWKPVPTSSSEPTRPRIVGPPAVGSVIRERIFSRVLLPAPFRPMMPEHLAVRRPRTTRRAAPRTSLAVAGGRAAADAVGAQPRRRRVASASRSVGTAPRAPEPVALAEPVDADRGRSRRRQMTSAKRALHPPEVEQCRRPGARERSARRTSASGPGGARRPEQRPAEALDHADHRVERVERPPRLGTRLRG